MSYRYEKSTGDIVIDGWENGITDNPYEGIYDMRNCDAVTIPGEVSVAMSTQAMNTQANITNVTITVDYTTGIFTYNGTIPLQIGTAITFTNSGGALPTGLSANVPYYILSIPLGTTFTIGSSAYGTQVIPSTNGTGTNTFSTINMGTPKFFKDTLVGTSAQFYRAYFMLDSNGRAWVLQHMYQPTPRNWIYMGNLASEGTTNYPNGLVAWHNYLFVFTVNSINAILINQPPLNGLQYSYITLGANWVNTWQATNTGINNGSYSDVSHYAMVSINDDSIYFCNENYIGIIALDTSAIYNPNNNIFSLAKGRTVTDGGVSSGSNIITSSTIHFTQADVGSIISSSVGLSNHAYITSVANASLAYISENASANSSPVTFTIPQTYVYNNMILPINSNDKANCLGELGSQLMIGGINNYIYPWDRVSPNFSTPIFLSENFISRLVTVNTTMYIFCGYKGRIFVTNGSNATPFYKIPDYLSGTTNPYFIWTDATFNRNQLYFGFQVTNNAGTAITTMGGLWAVDVDSVQLGAPRLQNEMSYGTYTGYVSAISTNRFESSGDFLTLPSADGYGLFMGWYDGVSASNIDIGISTPYTAGQSYVDTDPVPIGQYLTEKTLSGLEYKLGQPLASGESIAIAYRTQLSGAYTDNPLDTYITGNVSGWGVPIFEKSQWVQFRITLTSTATNPSYCRVREIRLHLT